MLDKVTAYIFAFTAIALLGSSPAFAADDIDKLLDTPLKDLMNMEVTSVSKKSEKATEAAAAIYVITQEDIKRSGVASIPEALRMAPGIQVSRINASAWEVTSRGSASRSQFENKLLVLIDGRSVYNPLFSGVLWEEQSTPLEDIDRIEVIRGPGSTLWGANAVNGVINIITKNSKNTQGTLVSAGAGSFEKFSGMARQGGKINDNTTYRAYVQDYENGNTKGLNGNSINDSWHMSRTGFRADGDNKQGTNYTIQGDLYQGKKNEQFDLLPSLTGSFNPSAGLVVNAPDTHNMLGGNLLGSYNKKLDDGSDLDIQLYYDYTQRGLDIFSQKVSTIDFDAQHSINLSENHAFLWGVGYRLISYDLGGSDILRYKAVDEQSSVNLFNSFLQDKIQLVPDELFLTLGSKFEHNEYTGFEFEPNVRLTWLPTSNQTVWSAVSRAVRTPSINERNLTQIIAAFPGPAYGAYTVDGRLESEDLIAYELGYRIQPTDKLSFDVTGFVNDYSNLRTFEQSGPIAPDIAASYTLSNKASGMNKGLEFSSNWEITKNWSLSGGYSYIDSHIKLDRDSTDNLFGSTDKERSPRNMFNARSHYKIADQLQMNNTLYYVAKLPTDQVPSYYRLDTNVIWNVSDGIDLSLVGQNLLDGEHQEFGGATYNSPSEIPRSVFGKVTVRF